MKKLILFILFLIPVIGFSQTLSDQNLNTIKKQSTSQLRSYNMFQALIDSIHAGIGSGYLHQGANTLTEDLFFDGAHDITFGATTPIGNFTIDQSGGQESRFWPDQAQFVGYSGDAAGIQIGAGYGGPPDFPYVTISSSTPYRSEISIGNVVHSGISLLTGTTSAPVERFFIADDGGMNFTPSSDIIFEPSVTNSMSVFFGNANTFANFEVQTGNTGDIKLTSTNGSTNSILTMMPTSNSLVYQAVSTQHGFSATSTGAYMKYSSSASANSIHALSTGISIKTSSVPTFPGTERLLVSPAGLFTFTLGSDATGDIFYRNSSGNFVRLGIGSSSQVLTVSGGLPSWAASAGGGNPFDDGTAIIKGSADATKLLRIEVDGFTTGTTRVATFPNADITVASINVAQTFAPIQTFTLVPVFTAGLGSATTTTDPTGTSSTKIINSAFLQQEITANLEPIPIRVVVGGLERTSLTAYGLIVGGTTTTSATQSVAAGTALQFLQSGGASALPAWSTSTIPASAGTARKILVSDGTNYVLSTETYAVPGSSGNVLTSDGTNWTSAAPASGMTNPMTTAGDLITSSSGSTPARIAAVGLGQVFISKGTSTVPAWSNVLTLTGTVAGSYVPIITQNTSNNSGAFNFGIQMLNDAGGTGALLFVNSSTNSANYAGANGLSLINFYNGNLAFGGNNNAILGITPGNGGVLLANGVFSSIAITASTRLDVRGIGTTTGVALRIADSGNALRLNYLDNGTMAFTQAAQSATNTFVSWTQAVHTGGSPTGLLFTGGAHTTLAASTEASDVVFALNRTVQFATGALTTERAIWMKGATYGFVGASTLTNPYTLYVDPPVAGSNATFTNTWAAGFNGNVSIIGTGNLTMGSGNLTMGTGDLLLGTSSDGGSGRKITATGSSSDVSLTFKVKNQTFNFETTSGQALLVPIGAASGFTIQGTTTVISGDLQAQANLIVNTVGKGLLIKEGTNATMGTATLSSGVVTVSTTAVTANSRIFITDNGGTITNIGSLYISARTAGTSFVITSTNVLDASTVAWMIVEPAP